MERHKFRLLIVEDNQDDAFLLIRELKKAGYDIDPHVVCRENDLRQALVAENWDCVTSDHKMPEFSAPQAVKVVREIAPDVPLVIVSGELDLDLAVSLLKTGADDYVHKNELPLVVGAIETAKERSEVRIALRHERRVILEKERILRSYFDLPVVGAAILTPNQKILEANRYLAGLVGYDSSKLIGTDFAILLDSATSQDTCSQLSDLVAGRISSLEKELFLWHRDGRPVPVHLSANYYLGIDDTPDYIMCVVIDRSKEAVLQQQVDESAHLIDSVSTFAPIAFYLLNVKTMSFEYASDKVTQTYCLNKNELKRRGATIWPERLHPKDMRLFPRFWRNLSRLKDGSSLVARFRLRDSKGRYRTYLSENTIYKRDADGNPLIAFGVQIDETEQVKTETMLSDMIARFGKLVDIARVGIVSATEDSTILSANPAVEMLLGYEASELIGKKVNDITVPEHHELTTDTMMSLSHHASQAKTIQKAYYRKDGSICWARTTVTKVTLSDRIEHIAMIQDITDEVETLSRAKESEERMTKTFELCPEPLMLIDVGTRTIIEVNDVFVEAIGLEKQFAHGIDINSFGRMVDDQRFADLLTDCAQGRSLQEDSYELKDAKGKRIWLYPSYTHFDVCGTKHCLVLLIDNTELIENRLKNQ